MEFWLLLFIADPVGPRTHPAVVLPAPEYRSGINILRSQNSNIGSLTSGVRAVMVGKSTWKPLVLPLPGKIVNQNSITSVVI